MSDPQRETVPATERKHDPYADMCRCKPQGRCYGLAPFESLCRVFVTEEATDGR